ncbi:unnamed protein product [Meloidogyne enterolobii]|uniref:Uncharacterized protein n=3 Tax=Meloidogyne enterolobii TaxID=390850 RepID=A0ACB0Z1T9_MELEN|nr:unnamed protein product [Meloidogyne enterolobii]
MSPRLINLLKIFFFLFLLIEVAALTNLTTKRRKGGYEALWNLNKMAECKLGYSALAYNDYGCWCGVGGVGEPMDKIDSCCMAHDKCYDLAVDKGICFDVEFEYIDDYGWECKNKVINCPKTLNGCKEALCHCDKQVVDCWSKYPKPSIKTKCTHGKRIFSNILGIVFDSLKIFINFVSSLPNLVAGLFHRN